MDKIPKKSSLPKIGDNRLKFNSPSAWAWISSMWARRTGKNLYILLIIRSEDIASSLGCMGSTEASLMPKSTFLHVEASLLHKNCNILFIIY